MSIENSLKIILGFIERRMRLFSIIFLLIVLFFIVKIWGTGIKENDTNCKIESNLEFDGIITEYNGGKDHFSTSFNFILNDSIYTIPRSSKGLTLYVGDTIKKIKGEHKYYLKRCKLSTSITGKHYDTLVYICK